MEALLAALGHDVVELDRLQVQRTEVKVADKWKVELCTFGEFFSVVFFENEKK